MEVIGTRARRLPAPPHVVWRSLVDPHQPAARPWLALLDDEVEPRVLEAHEPQRVVWSSLWPSRPDDRVVIELSEDSGDTRLHWTMLTPHALPDASKTGHLRKRLNHLLFADLRFSYGQ